MGDGDLDEAKDSKKPAVILGLATGYPSLEPGPTWLLIVRKAFLATQYDKEPGGAGFEATGYPNFVL